MSIIAEDARLEGRLSAIKEYQISESFSHPDFDRIVHLAAFIFNAPIALISLVESERQVFPAHFGTSICETGLDTSFCVHAIKQPDLFIIPDSLQDARFRDNRLVTEEPKIRFYAGAPLRTPSGHIVGTLCVLDKQPRDGLAAHQRRSLEDLAALALEQLEVRRLEVARKVSKLRFEKMASTSSEGIICLDNMGRVSFWGAAAERLLGYESAEIVGRAITQIVPTRMQEKHHRELLHFSEGVLPRLVGRTSELVAQHKNGSELPIELSLSMWHEADGSGFGAMIRDISARRANEDRLFRLAHLDPLTELPNRTLLRSRIEAAIAKVEPICVLMLDLDGFKYVNDTYGHAAGDQLLKLVADRLVKSVRSSDTVARLGGDEFAILLPGIDNAVNANAVADALITSISAVFSVEGHVVSVGVSIGITLSTYPDQPIDEILADADLALYKAKNEGRHCHRLFSPVLRQAAVRKQAYQNELTRAFHNDEFELFYQPQIRIEDGALVGAEALLRWRHPERGLLSPGVFIPALESGPLAALVGDWVVRTACFQAAEWKTCQPDFRVAVNLFSAQFQAGNLSEKVRSALNDANLAPASLELEITENIILRHDETMIGPIRRLFEDGVGIAFDDYGTGYASLSMLKRYPLTRLKVDQGFVSDLCESSKDAAIIRAILFLGESFGLTVVAEGVETEEQLARLKKKGCPEAQGYLFGRPVSAVEFSERFVTACRLGLKKRA